MKIYVIDGNRRALEESHDQTMVLITPTKKKKKQKSARMIREKPDFSFISTGFMCIVILMSLDLHTWYILVTLCLVVNSLDHLLGV